MPATVTLYSRAGCQLCIEAEFELRQLAGRLGFVLDVVDIETDEDLLRRYFLEIPVVAVGERVVAQAPLDLRRLEGELRGALTGRT